MTACFRWSEHSLMTGGSLELDSLGTSIWYTLSIILIYVSLMKFTILANEQVLKKVEGISWMPVLCRLSENSFICRTKCGACLGLNTTELNVLFHYCKHILFFLCCVSGIWACEQQCIWNFIVSRHQEFHHSSSGCKQQAWWCSKNETMGSSAAWDMAGCTRSWTGRPCFARLTNMKTTTSTPVCC
jgi:hypothetical protein